MINLKLYRDSDGYPKVETSEDLKLLAWYLEDDIQSSITSCKELLQTIKDIKAGKIENWEGTGNSHTLTLTNSSATLVNEFMDDIAPLTITLEDLADAITQWRDFFTNPRT